MQEFCSVGFFLCCMKEPLFSYPPQKPASYLDNWNGPMQSDPIIMLSFLTEQQPLIFICCSAFMKENQADVKREIRAAFALFTLFFPNHPQLSVSQVEIKRLNEVRNHIDGLAERILSAQVNCVWVDWLQTLQIEIKHQELVQAVLKRFNNDAWANAPTSLRVAFLKDWLALLLCLEEKYSNVVTSQKD